MAVIEYKKGDHPQGLIGFRVARTLGSDKIRKEYFFSISVYGQDAERLAREKDAELACIAEQNRAKNALKRKSNYQFATGFCAKILVERKRRGGEVRTYFSPAFSVSHQGTEKAFRITKWGFNTAWTKAINHYAHVHGLDANQSLSLLARKPGKELFTGTLLTRLKAKGHKLSKRVLQDLLESDDD